MGIFFELMKHLLFILIALAIFAFSARAQTGFDSSRLSGDGRKAYQTLLAATQFTIGPAGYAGYSKEETALRTLLKENAGEEACANLVIDANHEGGLYGLLGLRFIKSDMFARHLQKYQLRPLPPERILAGVRVPQGKIVTMEGCFIFRVELTELLSQLEAGAFDKEFELDGKPSTITAMPNKALQLTAR